MDLNLIVGTALTIGGASVGYIVSIERRLTEINTKLSLVLLQTKCPLVAAEAPSLASGD